MVHTDFSIILALNLGELWMHTTWKKGLKLGIEFGLGLSFSVFRVCAMAFITPCQCVMSSPKVVLQIFKEFYRSVASVC